MEGWFRSLGTILKHDDVTAIYSRDVAHRCAVSYIRVSSATLVRTGFLTSMPKKIEPFWDGYITALSDARYSYSAIIEMWKKRGLYISKNLICSVVKKKGKAHIGLIPKGEKKNKHILGLLQAAPLKWSEKLKPLSWERIERLKEV